MTFPHTATISRLTDDGDGKSSYDTTGDVPCFLQPLDSEMTVAYGITMTKGYSCYFPTDTDIADGDRVVINSVSYGVSGVREHNYGSLAHKRAILEQA